MKQELPAREARGDNILFQELPWKPARNEANLSGRGSVPTILQDQQTNRRLSLPIGWANRGSNKSTTRKPESSGRLMSKSHAERTQLYLNRGQTPGHELEDWLQAEWELAKIGGNSPRTAPSLSTEEI